MNWSQNRLAFLVALLLVIASALFAVGTAIEHSQRGKHHTEQKGALSPPAKTGETPAEKKAKGETKPAEAASPATATAETGGETHSEKIAGVDPES